MNNVVNGKEGPIDIQVYDLEKAFDALWLEDSMNDLVDSLPASSQDDKVALIFEANRSKKVAINTRKSRNSTHSHARRDLGATKVLQHNRQNREKML